MAKYWHERTLIPLFYKNESTRRCISTVTYMSPQWRAKGWREDRLRSRVGRWMDDGERWRWGLQSRVDAVSMCELHLMHARRKPLPVVAHGTQRYKAAARHTHVARDVGGWWQERGGGGGGEGGGGDDQRACRVREWASEPARGRERAEGAWANERVR